MSGTASWIAGQKLLATELNDKINAHIKREGDTMTGMLTLASDPVGVLDAATKQYVDNKTSGVNVMRVSTVADMRAIATIGFPTDAQIICITNSYEGFEGWGGATYDWDYLWVSDGGDPTAVKPNDKLAADPGRWMLRTEGGNIPAPACGLRGDYIFPSSGAGEVLGKDNVSVLNALANYIASVTVNGRYFGAAISFPPGCYRFASLAALGTATRYIGSSYSTGNDFNSGTVFVFDGTGAQFNNAGLNVFESIRFVYRGIDLVPTEAGVDAYWDARLAELYGGFQWQPSHAYSVGDVCVVAGQCYKCTTAGTSNAASYAGPTGIDRTADSEIDNTCKWKFIGQITRVANAVVEAGQILVVRHRVYQVDTGGTTSSSVTTVPTSESTTPNSVTDGTALMHFVNQAGLCLRASSSLALNDCSIIGFCQGIQGVEGVKSTNLLMDCLHLMDLQNVGDITWHNNLRGRQLYAAAGAPQKRRKGVGLHFHTRVDGVHIRDCSVRLWHCNLRVSNAWAFITGFTTETKTDVWGQTGVELNNCMFTSYLRDCYLSGIIPLRLQLGSVASASIPPPSGVGSTSIMVDNCNLSCPATGAYTGFTDATHIPTHVICKSWGGRVILDNLQINRQGRLPFRFDKEYDPSTSVYMLRNAVIDEGGAIADMSISDVVLADASFAGKLHIDNIFRGINESNYVVGPGNDDSVQTSAATNGGTTNAQNGVSVLRLTHAAVIAAHTVTMPPVPYNGQSFALNTRSTVTALTINLPGGSTDTLEGAPATLTAGQTVIFKYIASVTTWIRMGVS